MPGPINPNLDHGPTAFERITMAVKQVEAIAHDQNPKPHDPNEQIVFTSTLRDGREVEVYVDYEQTTMAEEPDIRLHLVLVETPLESESFMVDPHDWTGRRVGASVPGEKLEGAAAAERMADRFDEVLVAATDKGERFLIINDSPKVG